MSRVSLFDLEYVIFDFETTGLDPNKGDDILEMGAVHLKGSTPTGEVFETLVNIGRKIPEEVKAIHGITDKEIQGKPTIDEAFPKFINFIGNKILIAHNAEFDLGFIRKYLKRFPSVLFNNICIDTRQLSKLLFSYEKSHSLNSIINRLDIAQDVNRHRSLGDCLLTAKVFSHFLDTLKRRKSATFHHIKSCVLMPPKIRSVVNSTQSQPTLF